MKLKIGRKCYQVKDLIEAREKFIEYRDHNPDGYGARPSSKCHNGIIDGKYMISYNGRIWEGVKYSEEQKEIVID